MSDDHKKSALRDAEESGCAGLLGGRARNVVNGKEFYASDASKSDGPFICPHCLSDAILKKCSEKMDHFAHKARLSPILGKKEKDLHDACTEELCRLLRAEFPDGKWEVERPIRENKEAKIPVLVPDVSGRIRNTRVAIEVQISSLTIPRIVQRTRDYSRRGIALIWIVPLTAPLGDLPFRPRLYERYLHSIYFGRTYYWWSGQGLTLKPVHYDPAERHIDYREWYKDGSHESAGGYDKKYKTIKTPLYGRDLHLSEDFYDIRRDAFTPDNERKEVPACLIWRDRLTDWWD